MTDYCLKPINKNKRKTDDWFTIYYGTQKQLHKK